VTIWCGIKGLDRDRQRAIYQPFILIMQLLALPTIQVIRHETWSGARLSRLDLPPCSFAGSDLRPCLQFFIAVNILMIVADESLVL
jgi:hypothetical protein